MHREFAQVAIWQDGLVRQAGQIATTPAALRVFADSLAPTDEVALEATGNTHPIVRLLQGRVARVVVSNPQKTGVIAEAKVKTDKVDAEILAQLLAMRGEFVPGLSALDSPAQILAWAVLLGYAQQLLTRVVDKQAQDVLEDVGGGGDVLLARPRPSHPPGPDPELGPNQRGELQPARGDSLKESQLAARSGPSPRRRTSPTPRIEQQTSKRQRGTS